MRDNTADLRVQLEEAQKTLALRKGYDDLAQKITSNRSLRPREDQRANLDKLEAEIQELELESQEYAQTWAERREQFGKIIEEGMQLRRLIRDEKEEVERREGMEEREDAEEGDAGSQRGRASGSGTPRPSDGVATPMQDPPKTATGGGLSVLDKEAARRGNSPLRNVLLASEDTVDVSDVEDADMAEDGEVSGDGEPSTSVPVDELLVVEEGREEGEEEGKPGLEAQMDVSYPER